MKTKKILTMAALALTFAACSNEDDALTQQSAEQPANGMITITATLAPKTNGTTRAVADNGDNKITVTWATGEHIAILYEVGSVKKVADAEITAVDGSGTATITFTIDGSTSDGTDCQIVYPKSAAKDDNSGVKAYDDMLNAQDGTLDAARDVRVGEGTIHTSPATLDVTTQPAAQFAIFKFTLGSAIDATHPLYIKDGSDNVVTTVTPTASTTTAYVAMPANGTSTTYNFFAETADNKIVKSGAATIVAGNFYQTTLAARYPLALASATTDDFGSVITSDGYICLNATGATAASKTAVAMICYIGNGEANTTYNSGLAIALGDYNPGHAYTWASAQEALSVSTSTNFADHRAFLNGIADTDTEAAKYAAPSYAAYLAKEGYQTTQAAPTTGTSNWFLPSTGQWLKFIEAVGVDVSSWSFDTWYYDATPVDKMNSLLEKAATGSSLKTDDCYWASSVYNNDYAIEIRFSSASSGIIVSYNSKYVTNYVRSFLAF